ncbi:hypothetical protein QE361_003179 [Sphingomonas sp. SORGH_AS802]|uniref:hypothetical protein n=1 Tax=unclassified Sphingomonas TaxID=196159 RepID=UPI00285519A8|nr:MULTISPECIES: hypothetical protein [unclassified Sphingomonas]MDR6128808.1 hypothetical protein [Sphingomonas sp. SORGH_AS_0438]MDR6136178.1 hypothetical protein [Sphingomonas sp. SORGH_AS_0802]
MRYDIEAMRKIADAADEYGVTMGKADFGKLLDAVERGHRAEDALAKVRGLLLDPQSTAIAA